MTTIPLTILDNFFDNPDIVKKWALSLDYLSDPEGRWPGKRTDSLQNIHSIFYNYVNEKVLSLFFENSKELNPQVHLYFQLIKDHPGEGWIHQDPNLFTFIIYLHESNPKIDCGTTLWSLNSNLIHPINSEKDVFTHKQRLLHHKNESYSLEHQEKFHKNYNKEISIPDKYNRLIAFSSEHFHSANNFNNNLSSRLTLIGFVHNISTSNLPVIRLKQTNML